MQLTLVLPNLLDASLAMVGKADTPALTRLLSSTTAPVLQRGGLEAIACAGIGIAKQDDWPIAPWLARAAGIDPGERYWLCAGPVTFVVSRDEVRLASMVSDLDPAESAALLSTLRAQFAPDGLEFFERGPGRWWIALEKSQRLATSAPAAALGKPLIAYLPRGDDAPQWRRWQSEMQMLLFDHPVNRVRQSRGAQPVSHVWIWGGGTLRASTLGASVAVLFANAPLPRELGHAAHVDVKAAPESFAALHAAGSGGKTLVWLDELDLRLVREQLTAFESAWAAPMQRAVDLRQLDLTLVIAGSSTTLLFKPPARGATERLRQRWAAVPALSTVLEPLVDA